MAPHPGPLLVDTNMILECHRVAAWRTLSQRYQTHTVEKCIEETQTGFQNRRPEQQIDVRALRASFSAIHAVSELEIADAILREPLIVNLDDGEKDLWSHALTRNDAWILCGPDKASLRVRVRLGLRDRLVCLEILLREKASPEVIKSSGILCEICFGIQFCYDFALDFSEIRRKTPFFGYGGPGRTRTCNQTVMSGRL